MNSESTPKPSNKPTVYSVGRMPDLELNLVEVALASGCGLQQYETPRALEDVASPSVTGCILYVTDSVDRSESDVASLRNHFRFLSIIVLTNSVSAENIVQLVRQGAHSVLSDAPEPGALTGTIDAAVEKSLSTKNLVDSSSDASVRMAEATPKELEVLDLVMAGKKNREIASELNITVRAVEDRRFRLMRKLQVESVAELVELAVTARFNNQGFVSPTGAPPEPSRDICLKGIEVWGPSDDSSELDLLQCAYRDASGFREASEGITFRRGQGLPGQIWQNRAPVFLDELINSSFVRRKAASEVGMTTAVGFPVFRNRKVVAVVLFLLEARPDVRAAFESWRIDPQTDHLTLSDGTYINCNRLRRLSRCLHLPVGEGLAGTAAEQRRPYATARFQEDTNVVRSAEFVADHLTAAAALPLMDSGSLIDDVFVVLNSNATPVFSLIQVWEDNGYGLKLVTEIADGVPTLNGQLHPVGAEPDTLQARCLDQQRPLIGTIGEASMVAVAREGSPSSIAIAVPTYSRGRHVAVTTFGCLQRT